MPVDGADGYYVDTTWAPWHREGHFSDYDLQVDVCSLIYQSPAQRVQAINQLVTGVYAQLLPLLQQQGGTINMQELTDIYAELLNLPRLKRAIQFAFQPAMEAASSKPSSTSREYIRRSVPGGTSMPAQSQIQQQAWARGAGSSPANGVARFK